MATKNKPNITSPDTFTISVAELLNNSSITFTKLSGSKNYLPWSAAIQTFLTSKEKFKYIEEEKPKAASTVWVKDDAQVQIGYRIV